MSDIKPLTDEEIVDIQSQHIKPDAMCGYCRTHEGYCIEARLLAILAARDAKIAEQNERIRFFEGIALVNKTEAEKQHAENAKLKAERDALVVQVERQQAHIAAWARPFLCPSCHHQIALFPPKAQPSEPEPEKPQGCEYTELDGFGCDRPAVSRTRCAAHQEPTSR